MASAIGTAVIGILALAGDASSTINRLFFYKYSVAEHPKETGWPQMKRLAAMEWIKGYDELHKVTKQASG